jgi:hypothetical protein
MAVATVDWVANPSAGLVTVFPSTSTARCKTGGHRTNRLSPVVEPKGGLDRQRDGLPMVQEEPLAEGGAHLHLDQHVTRVIDGDCACTGKAHGRAQVDGAAADEERGVECATPDGDVARDAAAIVDGQGLAGHGGTAWVDIDHSRVPALVEERVYCAVASERRPPDDVAPRVDGGGGAPVASQGPEIGDGVGRCVRDGTACGEGRDEQGPR